MAQLVVKRTPWWAAHKKGLMVVLPLVTLQAATLIGFGYFYYRLDTLERQAVNSAPVSVMPEAENSVPFRPFVMAQQDVADVDGTASVQLNNVEFALKASPEESESKLEAQTAHGGKLKAIESKKVLILSPANKPEQQLQKQKADVLHEEKRKAVEKKGKTAAPVTVARISSSQSVASKQPAPANESVWVFLGERRDYGWYGQMLHIPPGSGLPTAGKLYQTQYIQRVFDAPYGKVVRGKFHLGEWIYLNEVAKGRKNDVWGRVTPR